MIIKKNRRTISGKYGNFTLSIWFNFFNIVDTHQYLLNFSKDYTTDYDKERIEIRTNGYQNNKYSLIIRLSDENSNYFDWTTGYDFTKMNNHNLTISFGNQSSLVYIDGVLTLTNITPAILKTKTIRNSHYLGRGSSLDSNKDFYISNFSLWNIDLSGNEIKELYNLGYNYKFEQDVSESIISIKEPFTLSFNNGSIVTFLPKTFLYIE